MRPHKHFDTLHASYAGPASPRLAQDSTIGTLTGSTGANCQLIRDGGCRSFHSQSPVAALPVPRGKKDCILDCNRVGNCLATRGICQCPAGRFWPGRPMGVSQRWRAWLLIEDAGLACH